MNIKLNPVKSSNIEAIGWDSPTSSLVVLFHNGKTYSYTPVPEEVYFDMYNADSVGVYFALNIRNKPGIVCKQI